MRLTKIKIDNYKSIWHIELDVNKKGDSYTVMLLWVNESWKSNILEAISFYDKANTEINYSEYHNYKNDKDDYIDLYYWLEFEDKSYCYNEFKKTIPWWNIVNFEIVNIEKNVYLSANNNKLEEQYTFNIVLLNENISFRKITENKNDNWVVKQITSYSFKENKNDEEWYTKLSEDSFCEEFWEKIVEMIKRNEPKISVRKPSEDKYSVWNVDLNPFKDNINNNIPLKNIFAIAWYTDKSQIWEVIKQITTDTQARKKYSKLFSKKLTEYIRNIRNHNIEFDVEFTDSNKCNVSVKDSWSENEIYFFNVSSRSEWFKHFLSLILSLSVETEKFNENNRILLIDEPEVRLHPSWIRDLRNELLKIWENNYVFIATHSPFIVDKSHIDRHILVKKNELAITEIEVLSDERNILDDEVLSTAFWINVYKDLLLPKKILVEWATDKIVISKIFSLAWVNDIWITNSFWSKIVQTASMYNDEWISMHVLVDSDDEWQSFKEKILDIWWVYNRSNVHTIKDLIPDIKDWATIEDIFPKDFVESKTKEFFKEKYESDELLQNIELIDDEPFLKQIMRHFYIVKKNKIEKSDLSDLKSKIVNDYKYTKIELKRANYISKLLNSLKEIVS